MNADACPFDLCDGSGFVVDDGTNTRERLPLPRAARQPCARASAERRDPAQVPRRVVRSPARDRDRGPDHRSRCGASSRASTTTSTPAAGCGSSAPSGRARRRWRCSSRATRSRPGAASRSTRCRACWPRSARRSTTAAGLSYVDLLDRLTAVDLLHIDDVGAEKTSPWVLEQLYAIVNARYEDERSIVITTNLERDELAEQINERTVSRLEEMCEILPLWGADARRQRPAAQPRRAIGLAADPPRLARRYARNLHRGRPVGRRGQGEGRRPARRAGRRDRPLPGRQQRRPHDHPQRRGLQVPPDPVRDPLSRQALHHRQRRRHRPAAC